MAETAVTPVESKTTRASRARAVILSIAALVAIAAWIGYREGVSKSRVHWHTGTAYSVDAQISATADGWTYAIPLDVPWEDNIGGWHNGVRPACLPPTGTDLRVRFAEIGGTVEGTGFRQVVLVSCKN